MYGSNALGMPRCAEGVPVSGVYYDRASSVIAGGEAGLRAGDGGVGIGRFGWASPAGLVLNSRTSTEDIQGVVVIQQGDWRWVFWDDTSQTWRIRQGYPVTLLSASPGMWVKIEGGGCAWNVRVYADPVDGRPIAGYAAGLEPSPWAVGMPYGPGSLTLITTWNKPDE